MSVPYLVGQAPTLAVAFSNKLTPANQTVIVAATGQSIAYSGALIDPATVTLTVKDPDNNSTVYTYGVGAVILKDATGVYFASILVTVSGSWSYKWSGDGGTLQAKVSQGVFAVTEPLA